MKSVQVTMLIAVLCFATLPLFTQHYQGQTELGIYGSAVKLVGGEKDDDIISPLFGLKLGYTVSPKFILMLNGGYGNTYPKDPSKSGYMKYFKKYPDTPYKTTLMPILVNAQMNFRPQKKFNPYVDLGGGLLMWNLKSDGNSVHGSVKNALAEVGMGFEIFFTELLGLDAGIHYQNIIQQKKDMSGYGDVQSGNIEARLGLNFCFGGKKDKDKDGINDKYDVCPDQPEDMDGFEDSDGCPDLDNDEDGIPDLTDQAPNEAEDLDGFEDTDGIPDLDNDQDGIPDLNDKAPDQAEDMDGFEDTDGMPDLDNDQDGILDAADNCPDEPETMNGFQDDDGCPDKKPEVVIEKEAPIVLEGVTFESGSAALTSGAKKILDKVYQTMIDYPDMVLQVNGYTDSSGSRKNNIKLSQRRADAVKQHIVEKGIESNRILAKGYGPEKPLASNNTAKGRAKNRRIEFVRIK